MEKSSRRQWPRPLGRVGLLDPAARVVRYENPATTGPLVRRALCLRTPGELRLRRSGRSFAERAAQKLSARHTRLLPTVGREAHNAAKQVRSATHSSLRGLSRTYRTDRSTPVSSRGCDGVSVSVSNSHWTHPLAGACAEKGADFVISRTNDTFGNTEYIGVIAKVGKIVQDLADIERQIAECEMPRLVQGGKKKVRITEIWVVATKHITQGAKEKIFHKYSTRKIEFIDGATFEKLVDQYTPLAWSHLPIAVGEYLQQLRTRTEEQDKSVSLLQISDQAFYVHQDLYHLRDTEYRYRGKHKPERVDVDRISELHRCILIEGDVGSGKSKLLRRLIFEATVPEVFSNTKVLPLSASYTELMEKHSGDLTKLIEQRVPPVVQKPCYDAEYLVLIDAFDERRMETDRQADELNAIFDQASEEKRIRVVVTSRFLKGVERGDVLRSDVARYELRPLSMQRTFEFIAKMCAKVNVEDRTLEDLKKSALFRNLPRSPMSAILLARLLNENQQEIPSNITELYAKYSELILGRWDERKGLQSQKEYQAPR